MQKTCNTPFIAAICALFLVPAVPLSLLAGEGISVPEGMVYVPAGDFLMGDDVGNFDEIPAHQVRLSSYYIDRLEVTVAQYDAFVQSTGGYDTVEGPWFRISTAGCIAMLQHFEKRYGVAFADFTPAQPTDPVDAERLTRDTLCWKAVVASLRVLLGADHAPLADRPAAEIAVADETQLRIASEAYMPVRFVTWRDAAAYARWAGKRLPTEAEWEKAARGSDGRKFPWGNQWDPQRTRSGLDAHAGPVAVGSFPEGASPYGCLDMAGNVWEWCEDWFGEFYYRECPEGIIDPKGPKGLPNGEIPAPDPNVNQLQNPYVQGRESDTRKIVRGGCWAGGMIGMTAFNNRCARRLWSNPDYWSQDTGFRCAMDAPQSPDLTESL